MQHLSTLTNEDLLMVLIGKRAARKLASKPLHILFGLCPKQFAVREEMEDYSIPPALMAAKELFLRGLEGLMKETDVASDPSWAKRFLIGKLGGNGHEEFWCVWLDQKHCLIAAERMFNGTINEAAVYPREVVKRAVALNAAAVILAHNHPSGEPSPSREDEALTKRLQSALYLIGVRVLDHIIVAGTRASSMAERGLL